MRSIAGLVLAAAIAGTGCTREAARDARPVLRVGSSSKLRVQALREREGALRSRLSPAEQPAWLDVSGSDPYRIVRRGDGFVGVLRGSKALVSLDAELEELGRAALPDSPTALCVAGDTAFAASRYAARVWRLELGVAPHLTGSFAIEASGVADLACDTRGPVHVLSVDARLLTLAQDGRVLDRRPAPPGGLRLLRRGRYLLESSLFEHSLRVLELDARGVPSRELGRVVHDGPLWAFDALEQGSDLLIAVAGVEDKPLVRAHGEFENIDSFVWLYRLGSRLEQLAALDVSDQGLVLPKAVALARTGAGLSLTALSAGSGRLLRARFSGDFREPPQLTTEPVPPGASDAVFGASPHDIAFADPLFDAWVRLDRGGYRITRVEPESRPEPSLRLGEALFFTELMAPESSSAGSHSRFSCETCHFEGGVDGRVHYTGRADVSVVTKPLFGLANNRPHFSRAMDPDLSSVCHNEFRVAGAGSGRDPWFTLEAARFTWLHELGIDAGELGPLELRAALLGFLYGFSHAPNAHAQNQRHFSALQAEGALAFREHCAGCHAPRLLSDDASSAVPFEDWERLVLSRSSPIVWARGEYEKTGVLPYVHERGTRITSLRRLELKPRYFTNGSAPDLAAVLATFRTGPSGARHTAQADPQLAALPPATARALLAFLLLL